MTDQPATLAAALAELQTQLPHIAKDADRQVRQGRQAARTVRRPRRPSPARSCPSWAASVCRSRPCPTPATTASSYLAVRPAARLRRPRTCGLYPLPASGTPQQIGSAITYARRYCLCAVTGVAPDDDDDDGEERRQGETAAHQGDGHRRRDMNGCANGTVEPTPDDRPATRVKAGQNGGGDPWQDQPAGEFDAASVQPEDRPGSADSKQLRDIHTRLTRLGYTERDRGLKTIEEIIAGPLDGPHQAEDGTPRTSKNLSWQEAEKVRKDLDNRIAAAKAAAEAVSP